MTDNETIYPRLLEPVIREALADTPVVCVLGPRQAGKTTLVQRLAPERAYISLDENNYFRTAVDDPDGFISSLPDVVTLDEVQRAPAVLPAIKRAVDRDRRPGRFLLTGSANLLFVPRVTESLAGRMEIAQLYPLTEVEKERKPGRFLSALLGGTLRPEIKGGTVTAETGLAERLVAGGYPEPLGRPPQRARQWYRQYLRIIVERDVQDIARVQDAQVLARVLELLALRSAQLLNASALASDLGLRRPTVDHYLAVLERLFLVRRLPAWHGNTAKRLVKTPKVYLLDSGLASALCDLTAADWLHHRDRMGPLLESFVVQQLVAQAAWTDPGLRFWHYRDADQIEVDIVLTRGSKTWGVEVKAAASLTDGDGRGLKRLADRCGDDFQGGILLYAGQDILPLGDKRMLAVPLNALWKR
ncbi:MAG: ATP-binding protein [Deltaproteobacteria bacterium]|nr:ATP-binding protein [Deltaproteobacteria bacterium]